MSQASAASRSLLTRRSGTCEDLEKRDAATFGLALTYIRKAPIEVQTPVRDAVKKRWP